MNKRQINIPKGTRDFTPKVMARRNYIFETIKTVFKLHGFQQIETPALENISTLMGKYGDEGDKLLFRILNSGDFMSKLEQTEEQLTSDAVIQEIAEKGLRYDLTVPLARFVAMHRDDLQFPFKRYQIQNVWRADKPQRGRYREFTQCDADIVGSNGLLNEVEIIQMLDEVFFKMGIDATIKINNRKILAGIAEYVGYTDKLEEIATAIDKLDKKSRISVNLELVQKGLTGEAITKLDEILQLEGTNEGKLVYLKRTLDNNVGDEGVSELDHLFEYLNNLDWHNNIELDLSLARGLNYYTGTIIEVKANNGLSVSIAGGGRYDNLTSVFGLDGVSGVGISFGADRIYDVLEELDLFPENLDEQTKILFLNFGFYESLECLDYITKLRAKGINAELYPDAVKIQKQFKYANQRGIPYVGIVGEQELSDGIIRIRRMSDGNEELILENTLEILLLNGNQSLS